MRSLLQRSIVVAAIGCAAVGGYVAWQADESPMDTMPATITPPASENSGQDNVSQQVAQRMDPHLAWAEAQSEQAVEDSLATLDAFFEQARQGVPAFTESALSLQSKWKLVMDYIPGTAGDCHTEFLRAEFSRTVFSTADLQQAVKQVVQRYLTELRATEGQMLLRMKADLADLPQESLPPQLMPAGLEEHFQTALREVQGAVSRELGSDALCVAASTVGGSLATDLAMVVLEQLGSRLGVSGGILAAGAESGWATFGVGMAVGFMVDYVVGQVWNWYADPQGQLQELLDRQLTHLHRLLVDDDEGLRQRLQKLSQARAALRRAAITRLVDGKKE